MKKDILYKIFHQRLHRFNDIEESTQDFIRALSHDFFRHLTDTAHVPQDHRESVLEDIEAEAIEMFRKKTYGHTTLKSYRLSLGKTKAS